MFRIIRRRPSGSRIGSSDDHELTMAGRRDRLKTPVFARAQIGTSTVASLRSLGFPVEASEFVLA
jgi:hypothetical protein